MNEIALRPTARVLLLGPDDRILMMKGRLTAAPDAPAYWFTVGGGIEPGESLGEAALREIAEETGFLDTALGPIAATREAVVDLGPGGLLRVQESYVVARCAGGEPSRDGWQDLERALVDDIRWWSLEEIAASAEVFFPPGLTDLLAEVLAGRPPCPPRVLADLHPALAAP